MKFAILTVVALASVASADKCSSDDLQACYNLENMIANDHVTWPKNDAEVVKLCGKLAEGGKCLHEFNLRCTKNEKEKKLLAEVGAAMKAHHDEVCDTPKHRGEFLERTKCYGKDVVEKEIAAEHRRYVGLVESISKFPNTQWVQAVCCADLYARDAGRKTDVDHCDASVVTYLDELIKKIFANSFHAICGPLTTYKECNAKLPAPIKTQFDSIVNAVVPFPTVENIALPTLLKLWKGHAV